MFKKKLSLIASFGMLMISVPAVTACGVSLSDLANRSINDPTYYRTYFQYPITSWSTGVTNQAEDHKFMADLFGTLVGADKYNRSFGDIALQTDKSSKNVGQPNADASIWTYKIAPDAKWFDYQGHYLRNIKASDMINAAKYALFPKNLSATFSLWLSFMAGAQAIWDYFQNDYQPKMNVPYFQDPIWNKLGMTTNTADDEITIKLTKPVPYFDTVMTYLGFAPLPEIALTKGYNYGANYQNVWYSGAYLVKKYDSSSQLILHKNDQYRFAKLTFIKNIDAVYIGAADVSRTRLLFESGDLSEFQVSPSDVSGWNKYVGKDQTNPIFGGAMTTNNPELSTFFLMYNFANANIINGTDAHAQNEALNAAKALQYQPLRKFLATNLDRSKFVRFFTQPLDSSATSSFLRNVYTARNFIYNKGKDYDSYIEDHYAHTFLNDDNAQAAKLLKDGSDAFLHNQILNPDNNALTTEISNWLRTNLNQSSVTLKILLNGTDNLTINKKILDMIDSFNNSNTIIKISPDISVDRSDYIRQLRQYNWDLLIAGWSPDFADPFTYLNTVTLNGDYQDYNGTSRIFSDLQFTKGLAPDYQNLSLNNPYWNKLKSNPAMADFYRMYQRYTNQVINSDAIAATDQIEQRYQSFAQAEFGALYQDFMFLPLYVRNGTYQTNVSYVNQRTKVTTGYGSSMYKHWNVQMMRYLVTKAQRAKIDAQYAADLELIKKDYGALRDDY